jgi:hypothetical protein
LFACRILRDWKKVEKSVEKIITAVEIHYKENHMTLCSDRINTYAKNYNALKYLEIGVSKGNTFFSVDMPLKVAVDPVFHFNPEDRYLSGVLYLQVSSDEFFSNFSEHPQSSLFAGQNGDTNFDIIYIDGLHTFEQSLRDFENSISFSHDNTIWIIDDTVPSDVFSAIPDQRFALECRKQAGGVGGAWHGDVFKTLFAIHDEHADFSYCTVMGKGNPQTVLWRVPALPSRKPRFSSRQEIAALGYTSILEHADLFFPVNDNLALALIGKSLDPPLYADANTWKKMLYRKIVGAGEESLKVKTAELEKKYIAMKEVAKNFKEKSMYLEKDIQHSIIVGKLMDRGGGGGQFPQFPAKLP